MGILYSYIIPHYTFINAHIKNVLCQLVYILKIFIKKIVGFEYQQILVKGNTLFLDKFGILSSFIVENCKY